MFTKIVVPDEVYQEISVKDEGGLTFLFLDKHFEKIGDIVIPPSIVAWDLGKGEGSVLSFALKNPEFWAIIDDKEARRCAVSLGCRYIGTVGIILLAKRRGIILSVKEALNKLRNTGLWLSEVFIKEVCQKANEKY
ncbi:MAG: DUF3368 domain-containing protein [bacterium]